MSHAPNLRLDLAHAGSFTLGQLRVEPSTRLLRNGQSSCVAEPRVMQLLVVLHEAKGGVLSRDDLIERCWGGVIVGENAIQRAVSQARRIAATIGEGSFEIRTIRGVGYRLVESCTEPVGAELRSSLGRAAVSRRLILGAAGAASIVAVAPFVLTGVGPIEESTERAFFERGQLMVRDETRPREAIDSFLNVIRISPDSAKAWSGLALAYWQQMFYAGPSTLDRLAALSQSAARRALELDPGQTTAAATLALVTPCFRNWSKLHGSLQKLSKQSDDWFVSRMLGWIAADTGDQAQAIHHYKRALSSEPLLPLVQSQLAQALWSSGRLTEAEQRLLDARRLWPVNFPIWQSLLDYFTFTGDVAAAERLLADRWNMPQFDHDDSLPFRLKLVRALDGGSSRDAAEATDAFLRLVRRCPASTGIAAMVFANTGAHDQLFDILDGYFLARGRYTVPLHRYSRRPTNFLFLPPLQRSHSDIRFKRLLSEVGLTSTLPSA